MSKLEKLARWVPPGFPLRRELTFYGWAAALSLLWSLGYLGWLTDARAILFIPETGELMPLSAPTFLALVTYSRCLLLYKLSLLLPLVFLLRHYAYHYQGSRSVYLMRRLPDHREFRRRCLALPLAALACFILLAAVTVLLYFGLYYLVMPDANIPPNQWKTLWRVIL